MMTPPARHRFRWISTALLWVATGQMAVACSKPRADAESRIELPRPSVKASEALRPAAPPLSILSMEVGRLKTNCFLAWDDATKAALVVDPGDDAARIWRALRERELDLKAIFITHNHFDHASAAVALQPLSGDLLFKGSVGRTDFPGGSRDELLRSLRERLSSLPDSTRVFPGHGDETTLG